MPFVFPQEIFEKVNKAYEFLCSKKAKSVDGPDPDNIVLILKSQSILFKRYKSGRYCAKRGPSLGFAVPLVSFFVSCFPFLMFSFVLSLCLVFLSLFFSIFLPLLSFVFLPFFLPSFLPFFLSSFLSFFLSFLPLFLLSFLSFFLSFVLFFLNFSLFLSFSFFLTYLHSALIHPHILTFFPPFSPSVCLSSISIFWYLFK